MNNQQETALKEYNITNDIIRLMRRLHHKNVQTTFRLLQRHQKPN